MPFAAGVEEIYTQRWFGGIPRYDEKHLATVAAVKNSLDGVAGIAATGAWADGDRTPLNHNEEFKQEDDALNVRARIEDVYAQGGFASISPDDLSGRFRWWGLWSLPLRGPCGEAAVVAAGVLNGLRPALAAATLAMLQAPCGRCSSWSWSPARRSCSATSA